MHYYIKKLGSQELGSVRNGKAQRGRYIYISKDKSVLELYFYIGEIIDNNIEWGNKFVDELSIELKIKFPKSKGYSTYYRTYLITHFVFNYHLMK